jgi:hypothetical protein
MGVCLALHFFSADLTMVRPLWYKFDNKGICLSVLSEKNTNAPHVVAYLTLIIK